MGGTNSKPEPKKVSTNFKNADLLDMIAAKYILTQNFKDMEKLSQKAYCDKLVILTTDVIKKFMNEKTIRYMAEKRSGYNNIPSNYMKNEKIMYFDTADVDKTASKHRFSKAELAKIKQAEEEEHSRQLLAQYHKNQQKKNGGGAAYNDFLRLLGTSNSDHRYQPSLAKPKLKPVKKRSILTELDVRNPTTKLRMCKGIARFYISIAHLYAAIVKTVNPLYVWKDSKNQIHQRDIMNRNNIPKGVTPTLITKNLCSNRIGLIAPQMEDDKVNINLTKVCNMNLKSREITRESDPNRPTQWGRVVRNIKNLSQEPGIPQLRELYNDYYDYTKGVFTKMIPGGDGEKQFNADLKEFYEAFTGNDVPYEEWNPENTKTFSDIKLENYQNTIVCNSNTSNYRRTYSGTGGLFTQYANHIKKMMATAETNRAAVLAILDSIFKIQTIDNEEKTEVVTINPELNDKKLMAITAKTRSAIVKLYVDCETDFKKALEMFNAITLIQKVKSTINREKTASAQIDVKLTNSIDKEVFSAISKSLQKPALSPAAAKVKTRAPDKSVDSLALSNLTPEQKNKLLLALLAQSKAS